MRSWILVVSLLAATGAAGASAKAADLDEGPPPDRYGSVYEDPRYADIYRRPEYRQPERPFAGTPPPPYAGPALPRDRVYRDDEEATARMGGTPAILLTTRVPVTVGSACRATSFATA